MCRQRNREAWSKVFCSIYGSGDIFLIFSPSKARILARSPAASLLDCRILLPQDLHCTGQPLSFAWPLHKHLFLCLLASVLQPMWCLLSLIPWFLPSLHTGSLHSLLPFVLYCLHGYFSIFPCWPPVPYSLYWKHWSTLLHPPKSQKWQFLLLNYAGLTFVLILVPDQHQPRGRIFFLEVWWYMVFESSRHLPCYWNGCL